MLQLTVMKAYSGEVEQYNIMYDGEEYGEDTSISNDMKAHALVSFI